MNRDSGWSFCRNLTDTLRYVKPRLLQNAEYWPGEFGDYPKSSQSIVALTKDGGAGFDVVQHDGLRGAVRDAIKTTSFGQSAAVNFDAIAGKPLSAGIRSRLAGCALC
jgi:1,4-alpha-glucan branching enzyme